MLGRTFPEPADAAERRDTVLNVLYVMFTEAHHSASGEPVHDVDLAAKAIRLTRMVRAAAPEDTEGRPGCWA